uniref:Uncharacterized protein n=1 Tax=Romanomermis culicivorax TaxID=13658 RepID=A0A915KCQ6_ROMCU
MMDQFQLSLKINTKISKSAVYCNPFDEMDHCMTVLLTSKGAALITQTDHCVCPRGYTCPKDPRRTMYQEKCDYFYDSRSWQCSMVCLPVQEKYVSSS